MLLVEAENVERMELDTASSARPASWMENLPPMMEKQGGTDIPEDCSIKMPSGSEMKKTHCGNSAWWSTEVRELTFP